MGKIAQFLHPQIRQKVLISAFIRAMKDPFPPARTAGTYRQPEGTAGVSKQVVFDKTN